VYKCWSSGPLLCLAFEISPTKARPHYCFFPFDLKNEIHKNYVSYISRQRRIDFQFLSDSHGVARTYEIPTHRVANLVERCEMAISEVNQFPLGLYDFERAVTEFEQSIRLTDYFQYARTESELSLIIGSYHELAAKVSPEDRLRAFGFANDRLEILRRECEDFARDFINYIPSLRLYLLLALDLHDYFGNDEKGFAHFLADSIAAHVPKEDYPHLETKFLLLKSFFKLMSDIREANASEQASGSQLEIDFQDFMARFSAGKGVSINGLTNLLSAVGIPLGHPGRTPKDYSEEYRLKVAGQSWSAVAAHNLKHDPETRNEFGGRTFGELVFEEKEKLKHRVREGVRSYADRTGKLFPPRETQSATDLIPNSAEQ
jgi:hypothetical protein